jgi:hypothetical protein
MTHLSITPNIELNPWEDLAADLADANRFGTISRIGLLPSGMVSGRPALMLAITLPDGRVVAGQTSWAMAKSALRALEASPVAELDELDTE